MPFPIRFLQDSNSCFSLHGYNIVYDSELDVAYTYQLKEDMKNGDLEIINNGGSHE